MNVYAIPTGVSSKTLEMTIYPFLLVGLEQTEDCPASKSENNCGLRTTLKERCCQHTCSMKTIFFLFFRRYVTGAVNCLAVAI